MTGPASPASMLDLLGAVARRLGTGDPPERALQEVVSLVATRLEVPNVRLWYREPRATTYRRVSHAASERGAEPVRAVPPPPEGFRRLVLLHEAEHFGVLDSHDPAGEPARETLAVVADMLSPYLAHLELSGDLAAEVALRSREVESQRRFISHVIDALPVGVYVIDREYCIQLWNRKRETGTQGLLRDDVLGRPLFEVLTRQPADELRAEFDDVFSSGEERQFEIEVTFPDERRTFRIRKVPMRLEGDATVSHVITIGEDVTHWRAVQQQVVQSEKLAAVGQLTAGIMHEINNPLATIGACVVAMEGRLADLAPEVRTVMLDYLGIVEKEVERCTSILDGLLDFSRPVGRSKAPVDVNALMEDTLFLVQHHKGFRLLEVSRELGSGLPEVDANGGQILQVFMAIILNAIDAMPQGGTLRVRTMADDTGHVVAEFQDTGRGIPRADLPKIFEPFFTTKEPGQGTGLGLSICYGIMQEHGGDIAVDSVPGEGSVFRVTLPVRP